MCIVKMLLVIDNASDGLNNNAQQTGQIVCGIMLQLVTRVATGDTRHTTGLLNQFQTPQDMHTCVHYLE